jgi:hypothetical protein
VARFAWIALCLVGCSAQSGADAGASSNLVFLGSGLGEDPVGRQAPLATAVGGTQRIKVVTAMDAGLAFSAQTSGEALGIASVAPPEVVVQGLSEGSATLNILDPSTHAVFGSLGLAVKKVDHADLKPRNYLNPAADMAFSTSAGKWVLMAGTQESCVVRLFDAQNNRLVDERLVMSITGSALSAGAQEAWDTLPVTAVATTGSGPVAIRTSDGVNRDGMIRIVSTIDDLAPVAAVGAASDPTAPQRAGAGTTYCFHATNATDLVAGVAFKFVVTGTGVTTSQPQGKNCVTVTAQQPTSSTLTVTAAGVSRDYPLSFTN